VGSGRLGASGLRVSRIGLGTVKIGRNRGVKYPASFELPTDREVEELLDGARALGVSLFDTAPAYGSSEERLGGFVQRHRDEIVICTKCGEEFTEKGSIFDYSGPALRKSVERSLRRLRCGVIDILLIHSNGDDRKILEETDAVEAVLAMKEEGLCRAVGISAKTEEGIDLASTMLDVVMAPCSAAHPGLEDSLSRAHDAGVGVLAIKGLASGHLGQGGQQEARRAFTSVLRRPFVDALIVGTLNLDHLRTAVSAAEELDLEAK